MLAGKKKTKKKPIVPLATLPPLSASSALPSWMPYAVGVIGLGAVLVIAFGGKKGS